MRSSGLGRIGSMAVLWMVVAVALAFAGPAHAQGSGHEHHGNPNNTCPLMAGGMHEMHVAAYHPTTGVFQELCTDIPGTGKVTITLDAVGTEIRDMTTEVKIVKGDGTAPDPVTLAHLPAQRYQSGVTTFAVDLDSPGQYALVVTLREGAMEMTGTHVVTVSHPLQQWLYVPVGAVAVLAVALFIYVRSERRKKAVPKSS